MFKFFRQYNKIILVVGGCVLMVAFLIPQAVTMFAPDQARETIGTMHGQKVTRGQAQSAAGELQMLQQLPFGTGMITRDETAWLMIQADARDMGLWASDREVDLALEAVGMDAQTVQQMAVDRRTTVDTIRQVVRRWLVAEQYRQIVMGTAYRDPRGGSPSLAVQRLETIYRYLQQVQNLPPQMQQQFAQYALIEANGSRRLSAPLLAHFARDNYAAVQGRAVLIRPDASDVETPDEATLQTVFDTYKDNLPADGKPFPFGYQYPDRVKFTALQLPMDEVRKQVEVDYLEVLDDYRANPQRFAGEDGEVPKTPTPDAVAELTEELTDRRAEQLSAKVIATVQGMLAENLRGQPEADGYLNLTEGFTSLPWNEVNEVVQQEHGVTLRVMGDPNQWVAVNALPAVPGIGRSTIGEGQGVPFAAYVSATKELAEDPGDILRSLRTQVGVASKPLRGFDGNLYLFRLLDAEKAHPPTGLDQVRDRVVADAKQIAAYEQLVADAASVRTRAVEEGLEEVAKSADAAVEALSPFQKVAGSGGEAPRVPGVGVSRAFVDAAFGLVESIDDPQADVSALPREQRVAVTPLPDAQGGPALAVFVLDDFTPLTRSGYEQAIASGATFTVDDALSIEGMQNPLSVEAIAKRVGFDLEAMEN